MIDIRFIPVRTGNMYIFNHTNHRKAVHPCAYREHVVELNAHVKMCGSSLCVQGTLEDTGICRMGIRFIPVRTGNISRIGLLKPSRTVHPCAYREHLTKLFEYHFRYGSSLCVQGTLFVVL